MNEFVKPMGGTELMYNELQKRLDGKFDNISIFNYPMYADTSKKTVYWNQLSYDQQAVNFLTDPNNVNQIDHFVFVSYWQAEMFKKLFPIPANKIKVIKNACIGVDERAKSTDGVVRVCYTSTPWRGLDVLIEAWDKLAPDNAELHVFSGTEIYGKDFHAQQKEYYTELYNKCKNTKGVIYRGNISNEALRNELPDFDILAYPSSFEETSCISVIEALSCGLRVVCSSLGALPETTEGWARMYNYVGNFEQHVALFSTILDDEINKARNGELNSQLHTQRSIYEPRWNWDARITEWEEFLRSI